MTRYAKTSGYTYVWNSQNPECRSTSPNREVPAALLRPRMPHKRLARHVLLAEHMGEWPRCFPRTTRWSDYISNLTFSHLGEGPAELSEIAVDREVSPVLLRLLHLRLSLEEKRGWNWMMNESLCGQDLYI